MKTFTQALRYVGTNPNFNQDSRSKMVRFISTKFKNCGNDTYISLNVLSLYFKLKNDNLENNYEYFVTMNSHLSQKLINFLRIPEFGGVIAVKNKIMLDMLKLLNKNLIYTITERDILDNVCTGTEEDFFSGSGTFLDKMCKL